MPSLRALLAACALMLLAVMPAQAQTKLRFFSWQTDDQSNSVWWLAANKAFGAAHPGVTIEFVKVPRDSLADTMMVMFGGNTPPDIVHLAAFEFPSFAQEGFLEDLTPMVARDKLDLKGWAGQERCVVRARPTASTSTTSATSCSTIRRCCKRLASLCRPTGSSFWTPPGA